MYYFFENDSCQIIFCTFHNCLWHCEFKKYQSTPYLIQDLLAKIETVLHRKMNPSQITGKYCFYHRLEVNLNHDFYAIAKNLVYYICCHSLDNKIYYITLNNQSITKELISTDSFHSYHPKNLKLASIMDSNYMFSIQNISVEEKSLVFLPLTKLGIPTVLLDVTTSCLEYDLFSLEHMICLAFPLKWEDYVLNLYTYHQQENEWSFHQTLVRSEFCFEHFCILHDNLTVHITYTVNVFGVRLLYYSAFPLHKKNTLIPQDELSQCNQSIEQTSELLYKTGLQITPTLLIRDNLLWISWLENRTTQSIYRIITDALP